MRLESLSARNVWLALMLLTALSTVVAETRTLGGASGLMVVGVAALKARMIIIDYMEARRGPGIWLHLYDAWLAAVTVIGLLIATLC
jgi:hypothetical protein